MKKYRSLCLIILCLCINNNLKLIGQEGISTIDSYNRSKHIDSLNFFCNMHINDNTSLSLSVYGYLDDRYELEFFYSNASRGSDIFFLIPLSKGRLYVNKDNEIIFHDQLNDFYFTGTLESNILIFNSGYNFLVNNLTLKYEGVYSKNPWEFKEDTVDKSHLSDVINHFANSHSNVDDISGTYGIYLISLTLYDNYHYDIYYCHELISSGVWERSNSLIMLKDENLNVVFNAGMISDSEIITINFPGTLLPDNNTDYPGDYRLIKQ